MTITSLGRKVLRPKFQADPKSVTLILRVKHKGVWRRLPAAYGGNGRVKPNFAIVNDRPVEFKDPAYEIRYFENRKPHYRRAGRNATHAEAERVRTQRQMTAVVGAEEAGIRVAVVEERMTVKAAAESYWKDAHAREAFEAEAQARQVMIEFMKVVDRVYVDEITRQDILRFHAVLRKRNLSDRTVANKHARLKSVLRFAGIDVNSVMPPEPKYDEKLPNVYSKEQLKSILIHAKGRMRIALLMALKLGLREGELAHAEFRDIDRAHAVFRIRSKPAYEHFVKAGEERDVPIPTDLLEELNAWSRKDSGKPATGLVLPTRYGNPDTKFLLALKRIAHRAGLNCKRCSGCDARNECAEWTLHRFRRTFLTTLLRQGIDLRTVQSYAGHSDLASTMRYLRPAEGKDAQARINAVQWC